VAAHNFSEREGRDDLYVVHLEAMPELARGDEEGTEHLLRLRCGDRGTRRAAHRRGGGAIDVLARHGGERY
jgi:hypothetical protein